MSENNEEKEIKKSLSKLGALLYQSQEKTNISKVNVYYSQNNWKTSEVVEIIVEDTTTVLQLIDSVIYKLKTEFYYDDIDENNYILMILKKKTKTPNYDYPKCNPESLVMNFDKSNFCLVEKEKPEEKIEEIDEDNNNEKGEIDIKEENKKEENNKEENNKEEIKKEEEKKEEKNKENKEEKKNVNKNKKKKKGKNNDNGACKKGCIIY